MNNTNEIESIVLSASHTTGFTTGDLYGGVNDLHRPLLYCDEHEVCVYNEQWGTFKLFYRIETSIKLEAYRRYQLDSGIRKLSTNVRTENDNFFLDLKRGDRILCSKLQGDMYRIEQFLTLEKLKEDFLAKTPSNYCK